MTDRPATEPRTAPWTESGRALEREIGGDYGEDIAAIEAEAAQGAAPRAEGLPSVEALAEAMHRRLNHPASAGGACDVCLDNARRDLAAAVGRFDRSWWHYADDCPVAPRAEGLDVERLRATLWGMKWDPDAQRFAQKIAAGYARLRPSDER